MESVRNELLARDLGEQFTIETNWTTLIKLLKQHKKDNKFFYPLTKYTAFKWNNSHFNADSGPLRNNIAHANKRL